MGSHPAPSPPTSRLQAQRIRLLMVGLGLAMTAAMLPYGPTQSFGSPNTPTTSAPVTDSAAACGQTDYRIPVGVSSQPTDERFDFEEAVFVDPPNPDGATVVDIGLFVVEVTNINQVNSTYELEAFLDLVWCDPRLAFEPGVEGTTRQIFLEEHAERKLGRIWWPAITLENGSATRNIENQVLAISANGTIEYKEKFNGVLEVQYQFSKFPFDRQTLRLDIESFAWNHQSLQFLAQEDLIGFSQEFEIPEWHTQAVHAIVKLEDEVRDQDPFSEFLVEIEVIRRPGYYILKIIVPLVLIVICSWSVFWMIGDGLADRMSVSLTGVLTIVAYQFVISDNLPRVAILTLMDSILLVSFSFMILTIIENVIVNVLYLREQEQIAHKIDLTCAYAFPGCYSLSLILLMIGYLLF